MILNAKSAAHFGNWTAAYKHDEAPERLVKPTIVMAPKSLVGLASPKPSSEQLIAAQSLVKGCEIDPTVFALWHKDIELHDLAKTISQKLSKLAIAQKGNDVYSVLYDESEMCLRPSIDIACVEFVDDAVDDYPIIERAYDDASSVFSVINQANTMPGSAVRLIEHLEDGEPLLTVLYKNSISEQFETKNVSLTFSSLKSINPSETHVSSLRMN